MLELPIGTIILWKNTTIPSGWAVCDGNNGTPALVDRFVMGAGSDSERGTTGGSSSHDHANPNTGSRGSHNHGGSKTFTASNPGGYTGTSGSGATDAPKNSHGHDSIAAEDISYEDAHSHTTPNTDQESSLPAYVGRVYIKRIS